MTNVELLDQHIATAFAHIHRAGLAKCTHTIDQLDRRAWSHLLSIYKAMKQKAVVSMWNDYSDPPLIGRYPR